MELISDKKKRSIVCNIVSSTKNISNLNKEGYKFISNAGGFIAHYNIFGFKDEYEINNLKTDILLHKDINQYDNFRKGDKDYDYYQQKKEIYNEVVKRIT